jgi:predicted DNA-binding transcriptional regulator
MAESMGSSPLRRFAGSLAEALRLPRTAARIVDVLSASRRHLSVREIVERVRMSERSVRGNLALLLRRGLLEREAVPTGRRLAYAYRLRPVEDLLRTVSAQFAGNLRRLKHAARRISPRSAASGRS